MGKYALIGLAFALLLGSAAPGQSGSRQPAPQRISESEARLRSAFPGDDRVLNATIKCYNPSGGLLFAADELRLQADGRLELTPCAIAWFSRGDNGTQPTTVRSSAAILEYDGPVRQLSDIGNRHVVSIELPNGVRLTRTK